MDYQRFLEKGYRLLATKFEDYRLFVLHFKITDYWDIIIGYYRIDYFNIKGY